MKLKYFLIFPIALLLLSSTISNATEVQAGAKDFERKGKEFVILAEKILADKRQGINPTAEQLQRIKALLPYHPKKYKAHLLSEINALLVKKIPTAQEQITSEEDPDVILLGVQNGDAKFPKLLPTEQAFLDLFGKLAPKFIEDLKIEAAKKDKYSKILSNIIQQAIDGKKIYPGRDISKIEAAKEKIKKQIIEEKLKQMPEQEKNKLTAEQKKELGTLTTQQEKDIINKLYPKSEIDKLRKMARNKLANEIIEMYIEDLTAKITSLENERKELENEKKKIVADKSKNASKDTTIVDKMALEIDKIAEKINNLKAAVKKQINEYRTKLIKSFESMAKDPIYGYNPEKIELLMTIDPLKTKTELEYLTAELDLATNRIQEMHRALSKRKVEWQQAGSKPAQEEELLQEIAKIQNEYNQKMEKQLEKENKARKYIQIITDNAEKVLRRDQSKETEKEKQERIKITQQILDKTLIDENIASLSGATFSHINNIYKLLTLELDLQKLKYIERPEIKDEIELQLNNSQIRNINNKIIEEKNKIDDQEKAYAELADILKNTRDKIDNGTITPEEINKIQNKTLINDQLAARIFDINSIDILYRRLAHAVDLKRLKDASN